MKISIFSAFYPFRGGIAQFNTRMAEELAENHEICAFTFRKQYPDFLFPGRTQFVESAVTDTLKAKRIVSTFNPFTYRSAAREIEKSHPEVFITNYWMTFFGPFMGLFARRLGKKVKKVALVHNLVPHEQRFFDKWLNAWFVKQYDGFIVLSDAVKRDVLALRPGAPVLELPHPLYDHFGALKDRKETRLKLGLSEDKKTLLFFGLIRDYKGLDNLIQAMSLLPQDVQLLIAGEVYGDERKYTRMIADCGRSEDIRFVNQYIPDAEVSLYFSAADLCVLPYRTATQSGITAIAHYLETPVLTTDVGGLKETVEHLKTGYIIGQSTPELIAGGVMDYFEQCREEEVREHINSVRRERSWKLFCEHVLTFVNNL